MDYGRTVSSLITINTKKHTSRERERERERADREKDAAETLHSRWMGHSPVQVRKDIP